MDCLRALGAGLVRFSAMHIVVVDNAAGDGSVERLTEAIERNAWQPWATVIASDRNGGFAYGNNVGIKPAMEASHRPEYVMLLNPDTVVHAGAIRALVDFMDGHPQAGIAGSLLESSDGRPDCSAHNDFTPIGELVSGESLGVLGRARRR